MKRRNLPPLNALKAFEAAARHGGFRAAAEELHVTHSVVGRHVRNLEARLGVRLFEQDRRGVRLTEAGAAYAKRIGSALAKISHATDELCVQHGPNSIRILVVPGFGSKWLAPRLEALAGEFPALTIVVEPTIDFSDVIGARADFGIGFGDPEELPGDLELLARPKVFPVCSEKYAGEFGPFEKPSDLLKATLIHEDFGEWWQDYFDFLEISATSETRLVYSTATQAIDAAKEHRGVALVNEFLVGTDGAMVDLIRLPLPAFDGGAYWLLWKDENEHSHRARQVADWLQKALRAT
ncbi:MAG: LysR family transcriptional regulator [Pseudomonadota bacterium]